MKIILITQITVLTTFTNQSADNFHKSQALADHINHINHSADSNFFDNFEYQATAPHANHINQKNHSPLPLMINENYKHSKLTADIIGCAMRVHKSLGNGFQEVIYQRALAIELTDSGINFRREVEMPVHYKEKHIGTRRVDFLVEEVICVELKALITLEPVHLAQAINYLEAYNLEIGLLINFGSTSLVFKRLTNKKHRL
jgi:GxxExxY protein